MAQENLFGIYRGIVCDVDDPYMQGRVRVQVYGIHRALYGSGDGVNFAFQIPVQVGPPLTEFSDAVVTMRDGGSSIGSGSWSGSGGSNYGVQIGSGFPAKWGYGSGAGSYGHLGSGPAGATVYGFGVPGAGSYGPPWINPVAYLPWAEVVGYIGRHKGDMPRYAIGDLVFVQFEHGLSNLPLVIGGWGSFRDGIGDLFPEQRINYPDSFKNWIRSDANSNHLSFLDGGIYSAAEVGAGDAVNMLDAFSRIGYWNSDTLLMQSDKSMIWSSSLVSVLSNVINIEARTALNGSDSRNHGFLGLLSDGMLVLSGDDSTMIGFNVVATGSTMGSGSNAGSGTMTQSYVAAIVPQNLTLGMLPGDFSAITYPGAPGGSASKLHTNKTYIGGSSITVSGMCIQINANGQINIWGNGGVQISGSQRTCNF